MGAGAGTAVDLSTAGRGATVLKTAEPRRPPPPLANPLPNLHWPATFEATVKGGTENQKAGHQVRYQEVAAFTCTRYKKINEAPFGGISSPRQLGTDET